MKKYRTIVADPPWPIMGDSNAPLRPFCAKGGRRARDTFFPYKVQSLEWIKSLKVADLAELNAHLYLWIPASFNRSGVGVEVVKAWGFAVVSEMVWDKINFGLGKFPRPQHEIILVCRRGNLPFQLNNVGSVQRWSRPYGMSHGSAGKIHSAKPEGFTNLVEQASPGPYLELFARRQRLGWDTWGDEAFNHVQVANVLRGRTLATDTNAARLAAMEIANAALQREIADLEDKCPEVALELAQLKLELNRLFLLRRGH